MEDLVDKLVLTVDGVVAIDRGAEGAGQLEQEDCHDTVNDLKPTFLSSLSLLILLLLLHLVSLVALEEEKTHEVDVVGQLLDFDNISQGHLGFLRDSELLTCVDIGLLILLMHLALT